MKKNKDTLGDRVKAYEAVTKPKLTRRTPVFIRVDGKAFHTFTKGCQKPFDEDLISCMVYATTKTAEQMQGFELAYTQSDEATFMLWDFNQLETQPWFGYEVNKLVSITASLFTAHFNNRWQELTGSRNSLALFDARAFNVPYEDWPNLS